MIHRYGNFGIVNTGSTMMSFSMGGAGNSLAPDWTGNSIMLRGNLLPDDYQNINGVKIIPYGVDNDLPGYVDRILSRFYAGEGIMGKKAGLQWGEGPHLYRPGVDEAGNRYYRSWVVDSRIEAMLEACDYKKVMHRCLIDLIHLEGFWVKIIRNRGPRAGIDGRIARIEHVPASKVRFVYAGEGVEPTEAVVGDFPTPSMQNMQRYPLFDPKQPFKHAVSLAYHQVYSYNKEHYSMPRFVGAFEWLELAGSLAGILTSYNENASAISMHIESPKSYWDTQEQKIREYCEAVGQPYRAELLEQFKNEAMEAFAASMSGGKNAGKFIQTSSFWNPEAESFEGWKVTPIDKKIKDYIEAQIAICKKAEAAVTSGFGLDPALSNLILDTKLGSGSEKLYSLKVYNATETAIPDMVLCAPFQTMIDANWPGCGLKLGLYRTVVEAEQNVSPENRVKANV